MSTFQNMNCVLNINSIEVLAKTETIPNRFISYMQIKDKKTICIIGGGHAPVLSKCAAKRAFDVTTHYLM